MGRHVATQPVIQTFHSKTPGRHTTEPASHPANLAAVTGALFAVATSGVTPQTIPELPPLETSKLTTIEVNPEVTAPADVVLTAEHPAMGSEAAPPDPVATTVATPVATAPPMPARPPVAPAMAPPAAPRHLAPPVTPPAPSEAPTAALPVPKGSVIAAAALAQLGVYQDCTALVSNSIRAVGIYFHGWPVDYERLGYITLLPQPGDLAYYANGGMGVPHIAVYIGGGMAVHGGWGGNHTVQESVNVGSGPIFIHIP